MKEKTFLIVSKWQFQYLSQSSTTYFLYSDCGITNPVSPLPPPISKIVNGMDSEVGMFPWQVQFV